MDILLVEDNEQDAEWIRRLLAKSPDRNYVVRRANNLDSVRQHLTEDVACILLDLNLPDSNGVETLQELRRLTALPVVVLTGIEDDRTAIQAIEEGAEEHLVKGKFAEKELLRAIRYAIARHHSEVQNRVAKHLRKDENSPYFGSEGELIRLHIAELSQSLRSTSQMLQVVMGSLHESEILQEKLRQEISVYKDNITTLLTIVRDGSDSIVTSMLRVEARVRRLEERMNAQDAEDASLQAANVQGRWGMWAALAAGVLGMIGGLLAAGLALFKKD